MKSICGSFFDSRFMEMMNGHLDSVREEILEFLDALRERTRCINIVNPLF